MATLFGTSIKRREDPRLLTGMAQYTDDIKLPRMVYSGFVRSPYAHARLKGIDVSAARAAPGVVAVYTGADVKDRLTPVPCAWNVPDCDLKIPPHPLLAHDKVRYVGDPVAMVVAETRAEVRDALWNLDKTARRPPAPYRDGQVHRRHQTAAHGVLWIREESLCPRAAQGNRRLSGPGRSRSGGRVHRGRR